MGTARGADHTAMRCGGTASAGIAVSQMADESFEFMLYRADTALYRAKDSGRDRVCAELQAVA